MMGSELKSLYLQRGALFANFSFFVLSLFCISLVLEADPQALSKSAPAFIWILASLTTLFSTPTSLKADVEAGRLDELFFTSTHPAFHLLSRVLAEWLVLGLPLACLSLLAMPLIGLPQPVAFTVSASLLIGFPALSALSLLGGLLTVHARGGAVLLAFLILPLCIPLWLFALSAVESMRLGLDSLAPFCLLSGVSLALAILALCANVWALRFVVEET